MEEMWDIKKLLEIQGNTHNKVEVQANSESRSLTSTLTRSLEQPCLQIDAQDVSDL
jgi:phage gp29-like protein